MLAVAVASRTECQMPPKHLSDSKDNKKAAVSNKQELDAIQVYLSHKPNFEELRKSGHGADPDSVQGRSTEYDLKLKEAVSQVIAESKGQAAARTFDMPVVPGDNDKEMKEKLAQGKAEAEAKKADKASSQHHNANLGPVMAENLGEPASKEELKKRAEELNK
ncbi:hypothetical protein AC579_4463 [Pseudocercospora musae]|uniref:Uncharacterized protein n=1 Tax=Pseudocercospora musae TaxID=113226 RepID=A0A139I1P2_9PEZI|nr:hypothetical protein AC579_4463 [Pseudocercospora musae]